MSETTLAALLRDAPPPWPTDLLPDIRRASAESGRKLVVLDDDPTGTQTVYDVPVLTEWSRETLKRELGGAASVVYLLTNSRSLPPAQAEALNFEVGERLREVAEPTPIVVSRSDSTLRGHYPGEVEALAQALGEPHHATLLAPFFLEGDRYTVRDVHYVREGDTLVPVGESEFAKDATFGFASSDLKAWVAEKTAGRVPAAEVTSLSLADIRGGGPDAVTERLLGLRGETVVVNAASLRDLEVVALAALRAENRGRRFLYRTAASFVQVLAGLAPRPPLSAADLAPGSGGGLVVVGSHVPKSTRQLEVLLAHHDLRHIEVAVSPLLDGRTRRRELERVVTAVERALQQGESVVVSTQRELLTANDTKNNAEGGLNDLEIGRLVSASLVEVVQELRTEPRFLVAKGGITSSDLATRGLGVKRAVVRGQVHPGVPVWELGAESRFPGLVYVVFPGNVGDDAALADVVQKLGGDAQPAR